MCTCAPGHYWSGAATCTECPAGQYAATTGATQCAPTTCGAGKAAPAGTPRYAEGLAHGGRTYAASLRVSKRSAKRAKELAARSGRRDGDGGSGECMVNYGGGGTRRRDGSDARAAP